MAKELEKKVTLKLPKFNLWILTTIICLVLALVALTGWPIELRTTGMATTGMTVALTGDQAAEKAIEWISSYFEAQGEDVDLKLINVTETESGIYQFTVKLTSAQGNSTQTYHVSKDGKLFLPEVIDTSQKIPQQPDQPDQPQETRTIGNFLIGKDEICKENGKPIIYFFGSDRCSHCRWEHPILSNVTSKFEGYISYHDNMGTEKDREVFSKYSPGSIPTLVFGCKYYRVGSGESIGQEQETKVLTALICKLTEGEPNDICSQVQDLISQI